MATTSEQCPICQHDKQLSILPCIHSFCLECLKEYCRSRSKQEGDNVPCPECNTGFNIPIGGIMKFPVKEYPTQRPSDDEIQKIRLHIERFRGLAASVTKEKDRMMEKFAVAKQEAKNRTTVIKQLVDCHERKLIDKLQSLKSDAETEILSKLDAVQSTLADLEKSLEFSASAENPPSDTGLTQAVSNMRLGELLQSHECIPGEYHAPSCRFVPVNIDEFLANKRNFIGHLDVKVEHSEGQTEQGASSSQNQQQPGASALSRQQSIVGSEGEQAKPDASSLEDQSQLGASAPSPQQSVIDSTGHVVGNLASDGVRVLGVTSVFDQLFVLLLRDENQVDVYSIHDLGLLPRINLPGLQAWYDNDMTSCARYSCLYAADCTGHCIHRYDLSSGALRQWSVSGEPCGLSVLPGSCNLLVTCRPDSKLVELSADRDGQCVREIVPNIAEVHHAFQLASTRQFIVCHGAWNNPLHRVCVLDADGTEMYSHGCHRGSLPGEFNWPRHMAVDEQLQAVFVADRYNDRVVLLRLPTLEPVHVLIEGLSQPRRLYLHQSTRRLFVGRVEDGVTVIQF